MTKEESILISAYTGYFLTKDWSDIHAFCEKVLGRPIFSHEFAAKEVWAELREKLLPMIAELRFDDEPVKRGEWLDAGYMEEWYGRMSKCSACGTQTMDDGKYCANCGAKMDDKRPAEE